MKIYSWVIRWNEEVASLIVAELVVTAVVDTDIAGHWVQLYRYLEVVYVVGSEDETDKGIGISKTFVRVVCEIAPLLSKAVLKLMTIHISRITGKPLHQT